MDNIEYLIKMILYVHDLQQIEYLVHKTINPKKFCTAYYTLCYFYVITSEFSFF